MMSGNRSREIGDSLERRAQRILGGTRVKQSGGGKFWKLDLSDKASFIYSCKATTSGAIRITGELMREARRAARGAVGTGDSFKPAIIAEVDGEAVVIISLEDFAYYMTNPNERYITESKSSERLRRALGG
jgi:PHD/YefM family antitoxin component YafN of YafNO toxin-antitoxin module